ncbi:hypothetical protein H4R20_003895 [Coemansia guatemalensis]|uniref:Kinesin motor domain-containing protein n=1 Tax=Coemansia guatemalensis TaxID=2761395 RepID=A0A9W8HSG5_9FUNG|nr:hypothetical protein H4R20_003895 [Coemansia guatemalensis]
MSANQFLDVLRDFELEHQYPCLHGYGITSVESLMQIDPSDLHMYGVTSEDDLGNLKGLIRELRAAYSLNRSGGYQPYSESATSSSSGNAHRRADRSIHGYSDDNDDTSGRDGGYGPSGGIPRPGGRGRAQGRRPSSIYGVPHAPSNGIPRATPSASFSPPMQSMQHSASAASLVHNDQRTVGRQGLPPPGNLAASRVTRRQTLAPSSHAFGHSRIGDNGTRTLTAKQGGGRKALGGPRPSLNNMKDILERSNVYNQTHNGGDDSDDDLERVVRKPGQSSLVNAYGIPVRPTTGHVKRSASERRSLVPGATGLRPKTAHRGSRGEAGLGLMPIKELSSNLNDKIRVCVRKRPLNSKEKKSEKDIVQTTSTRSLSVMEPKVKLDMTKYIEESRFFFDEVFDENTDNTYIYQRTAKPLVEYIFGGGNATCFAYGQTGSGKTYTMMDVHNGLYIQAAEDIFALLEQPQNQHLQAFVMFYEIYLTNLFDLLNERKKLFAREDANQNVCIQGGREILIQSPEDLMSVFEYGSGCRSTGSTGANSHSSRSHAILQIELKDTSKRRPTPRGKLSFIDLAGNERGADRGDKADKQTLMEGAEINKSLLALKECIRALDLNKKHLPFRQSKLTQVLKDSFIGNSRACMVATISPNTSNSDNTLNTLRYADRVKAMKSSGGGQAAGDSALDGEEYYGGDADALDYADDSAEREAEDQADVQYGWGDAHDDGHNLGGYRGNSREAFREEDEYGADDGGVDEFSAVNTTYGMHRHQQEQSASERSHGQRVSFEERLDNAIDEEAPSIMDEQPAFLEDIRVPPRSPRAYGSPAAKSFVSSRLAKSPSKKPRAPSQLTGLGSSKSEMAHGVGGGADGSRLPMMARSNSVGFEGVRAGEQPLSPSSIDSQPRQLEPARGMQTRSRGSTQSGAGDRQRHAADSSVPFMAVAGDALDSSISPADSGGARHTGSSDEVFDSGGAEGDIGTLVAPFGGLNIGDVDLLVKQHRAEIRTTTEVCREETALISAYTSFTYAQLAQQTKLKNKSDAMRTRQSSWQQQAQGLMDKYQLDLNTGVVTRLTDGEQFDSVEKAKMVEAFEYLEKLEEVLARKQQVIADLREGIRRLVWSASLPE